MPSLFCVRASFGSYAEDFFKGPYVSIGWLENIDLSQVNDKETITKLYEKKYPEDTSPYVIGQQVGQISRFLFDIKPDDYVITPTDDPEYLYWGQIPKDGKYYFDKKPKDNCPYQHRKPVKWNKEKLQRSQFSVPFQNSIRSSLTVFNIQDLTSFYEAIKIENKDAVDVASHLTATEAVLRRILQLDAKEFEILVTSLLQSLGFEAKHTGKPGDGGVDATGDLTIYGLVNVRLHVQVKRYDLGKKIDGNTVKDLRRNIPSGEYGAFITTCQFRKDAYEAAIEPGFPRIGTIDGNQLVDVLSEKWEEIEPNIPEEIRQKLSLRRGLIVE